MVAVLARMDVPFVDLRPVNLAVIDDLRSAFERVLASQSFIQGAEVEAFEERFAVVAGTRYAIGTSTGTSALQLALEAAGIGRGHEVILPTNSYFATAESVRAAGATPVLVDVDEDTALIDVHAVRAAIGPRTSAVIAVHLYGQPADMQALAGLTKRRGLLLLEDAAQAVGARWAERPVGSLGDAASFSFYPAKNLGALGESGAVTTSDPVLAERVRALRNHGQNRRHVHIRYSNNHRMHELQAAFLAAKLPHLAAGQALRDQAVLRYKRQLRDVAGVRRLRTRVGVRHVHHVLVVRVSERDRVMESMRSDGVETAVHYPTPIHLQPAAGGRWPAGSLPHAEALAGTILSLPLFAGMSDAQVDRAVGALAGAVRE